MNKYKVFRSFGSIDKDIRKHELIAVIQATCIEEAEESILKEIKDDLSETDDIKFRNYNVDAMELEPSEDHHKNKTYDYCSTGILYPDYADKNIVIEYGIIEEALNEV